MSEFEGRSGPVSGCVIVFLHCAAPCKVIGGTIEVKGGDAMNPRLNSDLQIP